MQTRGGRLWAVSRHKTFFTFFHIFFTKCFQNVSHVSTALEALGSHYFCFRRAPPVLHYLPPTQYSLTNQFCSWNRALIALISISSKDWPFSAQKFGFGLSLQCLILSWHLPTSWKHVQVISRPFPIKNTFSHFFHIFDMYPTPLRPPIRFISASAELLRSCTTFPQRKSH